MMNFIRAANVIIVSLFFTALLLILGTFTDVFAELFSKKNKAKGVRQCQN